MEAWVKICVILIEKTFLKILQKLCKVHFYTNLWVSCVYCLVEEFQEPMGFSLYLFVYSHLFVGGGSYGSSYAAQAGLKLLSSHLSFVGS